MNMSDIATALRGRGEKMFSLDTPKDQDGWDIAADIGAGFVPGLGTAQAMRDFERARRDDDYLGMGLSALSAVPVLGGMVKGARKLKTANEAVAPAAKRMSKQEAIDAGYWHPIGLGKKLNRPYQDMTFETEKAKDLPDRIVKTLEDFQGEYMIPAVGDRTAAGKYLKNVDGIDLQNPLYLEGGPDFMRTHGHSGIEDPTIWASKQGIISALRNRALEANKLGGEANLMYVPMAYDSLNFSHMPAEVALGMIGNSKISQKAKKAFDEEVRKIRPEFAGLNSPELAKQLRGTGALRHAFLNRMSLDQFKDAGFPDLAAIRKSIAEPDLENVPVYHGGYAIGKIDTSKPINKNPESPHSTYDTQLHGTYVGGLDQPIPHDMLWRDFFKNRRETNRPKSGDRMAFERSKPLQLIDQELIDTVAPYVEALRNRQ